MILQNCAYSFAYMHKVSLYKIGLLKQKQVSSVCIAELMRR